MAQPVSARQELASAPAPSGMARAAILWGGAGFAALIVLAAVMLWMHYGTTVFFEMIASGFAACF
jgi:hypothetical protein